MGADTFFDEGHGKSAKLAFDAAVAQAEWDYGHAGYTGTIAEDRARCAGGVRARVAVW